MTLFYFGPAGLPAGVGTYDEAMERLLALGLNALEVELVHGVRMKPHEAERVGALAVQKGVRLSVHAPYYVNLNSRTAGIVEKSRQRILDSLRRARLLRAGIVVVHAGYYSGSSASEATRSIAEQLARCREEADQEGCSGVLLGLETMGRRASWGTLAEMRGVCSHVERVYPVLDFAHLHARTRGGLGTAEAFALQLERFEEFGAPFLHCHFSGVEYGRGGERRHLEVSVRSPDFELLAPSLRRRGYDVTVISESPLLEKDALLMKTMLEGAEADAAAGRATKVVGGGGGGSWQSKLGQA